MENNRIIFLHLPKNAGTTFNSILQNKYTENETYKIEYNKNGIWNLDEFIALPQLEKDKIKFLTGHFNFGLHKQFSNDFKYITMLRHPVERTISFYNFVKRQKEHRLLDVVKNKTLLECVTQVKDFDVVNGQARKLSNSEDESLMLNAALENMDKHFQYVGLQELFDESIVLFNHKLNMGIKSYQQQNVAKNKPEIDAELIREIEKTNQVDLALYEIVKKRFLKELDDISFLPAKIALLKSTNKLKTVYNRLK